VAVRLRQWFAERGRTDGESRLAATGFVAYIEAKTGCGRHLP
jgi:hypothetical protein